MTAVSPEMEQLQAGHVAAGDLLEAIAARVPEAPVEDVLIYRLGDIHIQLGTRHPTTDMRPILTAVAEALGPVEAQIRSTTLSSLCVQLCWQDRRVYLTSYVVHDVEPLAAVA